MAVSTLDKGDAVNKLMSVDQWVDERGKIHFAFRRRGADEDTEYIAGVWSRHRIVDYIRARRREGQGRAELYVTGWRYWVK